MFLPIRTNIWPRRTPYANYALIAANIIIFLASYGGPFRYYLGGEPIVLPIHPRWAPLLLIPAGWQYWQFLTYAFLHGSYMHIIGNMFFLYIFGNNINDKLGHFWYVLFYLAGAIFSGIGHTLVNMHSPFPTLGASGAVAAVTGAYLVLFPQTLITVLYWFFFIGTVEVPALWFIGLKMILIDNMIARYTANVAYDAHVAGYTYGIGLTLFLLATRIVSSSSFDLWSMIKHWNRRRLYRDTVANGYDPFTWEEARKHVEAKEIPQPTGDMQQQTRIGQIRHEISRWITQRNLSAAADLYLQLMQIDREQVLPRQHLLDVANQLASDHRTIEAAQAYEQFLTHYGNYEYAEQVELMLGILYARYLHRPQEAVEHLQRACEKLSDPNQLEMCRQELARLQS